MTWRACLVGLALVFGQGCDAVQAFRTGPHDVFTGEVIGSNDQGSQPSFIRQGFASRTQMDLSFDPARAAAYLPPGSSKTTLPPAGTLDTYLCPSTATSCAQSERTPGDFQHSDLEVIPNLTHDALSEYDFPGGGRLHNYILVARFESSSGSTVVPRSAMVFLSLMENGSMEVRVIAPSMLDVDGKTELQPALFGVFLLSRHSK